MNRRFVHFLFFLLLVFLNRLLEYVGVNISWVAGYFDNVVVLPLCFSAFQLIYIQFYKKSPDIGLPVFWIIGSVVLFSVYFEAILPSFDSRFTADWVDSGMYLAGAVIYLLFFNKRKATKHQAVYQILER